MPQLAWLWQSAEAESNGNDDDVMDMTVGEKESGGAAVIFFNMYCELG